MKRASWGGLVDEEGRSVRLSDPEDDGPVSYDLAFGPVPRTHRRHVWSPASDACEPDPCLEGALTAIAAAQQARWNVNEFERAAKEVHDRWVRELEEAERSARLATDRAARQKAEERRRVIRQALAPPPQRGGWRMPSAEEMAERRALEAQHEAAKAARALERAEKSALRAREAAARAGAPHARANRYATPCSMCGLIVAAGDGVLAVPEAGGTWEARHRSLAECREEWRRTAEPVAVPERSA